jgi:5-formyltetrahydrofolate cyclo-ligase
MSTAAGAAAAMGEMGEGFYERTIASHPELEMGAAAAMGEGFYERTIASHPELEMSPESCVDSITRAFS